MAATVLRKGRYTFDITGVYTDLRLKTQDNRLTAMVATEWVRADVEAGGVVGEVWSSLELRTPRQWREFEPTISWWEGRIPWSAQSWILHEASRMLCCSQCLQKWTVSKGNRYTSLLLVLKLCAKIWSLDDTDSCVLLDPCSGEFTDRLW